MTDNTGFGEWIESWRRHLRAENKAPRTIRTYLEAVEQFAGHCPESDPRQVTKRQIEGYIAALQDAGRTASTVESRWVSLSLFFRWLVDEEEIDRSPMEKLRRPAVPEQPVPIIPVESIRAVLKACVGKTYKARRDLALLSLLADTGCRAGELLGLAVGDVEFEFEVVHVLGKGRRERSAPFGAKTSRALDRYLRARAAHPWAERTDALWLGQRGPLTIQGLHAILTERCAQAGIERVHPHQFRHTFAHDWLSKGGSEGDLMQIAGWKDRKMLDRYGRSTARERALDAYRGRSPLDAL